MTDHCRHCGAPTRDIHDEPRAGIPITINTTPATWTGALVAITQGRAAILRTTVKRRGGLAYEYWRVTAWRIPHGPWPGDTIHTQHTCEATDPTPQDATARHTPQPDIPDF